VDILSKKHLLNRWICMKTINRRIYQFLLLTFATLRVFGQSSWGPGYQWELFKGTPVWDLAQAVAKEDTSKMYGILKVNSTYINFQEPKFGKTLLILAVGNDKENAVAALLRSGARLEIVDSFGFMAIHEACKFISLKQHSLAILSLLLRYGADANAVSKGGGYVPLEGAITSLACTKLLLKHGANLYFRPAVNKDFRPFLVWQVMLSTSTIDTDSSIYVAKYLIVERRFKIPDPIAGSAQKGKLWDARSLLRRQNFHSFVNKEAIKQEILSYLDKIHFPKNGVYRGS
jgi:hypothetical protein